VELLKEAYDAGCRIYGENRVQELQQKNAENAYAGAPLYFIGHLQKNKVKYLVGVVDLIQSVDSLELIRLIDRRAESVGTVQDILLEVNIGREEAKSGLMKESLDDVLAQAGQFPHVHIRGLMAIPPICENGEENRRYFERMKQLFIDNCEKKYDNVRMDFMSMGMSGDYETAIACGANIVRVGSAIFGARIYPEKN
jgi:pyridoxal phosphate enzyme (YggS family)